MSQKGRIITLVVEFAEDEYPLWVEFPEDEHPLWIIDAHLKGPKRGVKVKAIAEGNLVEENEKLEEQYDDLRYESMGDDL